MSLLDDLARPKRRRPFDERPDPFGRLPELLPEPDARPAFDDPLALAEPVGADGRNRRDDVARIETLLDAAGYLDLDETDGPTGFFGQRLDQAIRRFQKDRGLKIDGAILPGGETIGAFAALVPSQPSSLERPRWTTPPIVPDRDERALDPKTMGRVLAMMRPTEPPDSARHIPASAGAVPALIPGLVGIAALAEYMRREQERRQRSAPNDQGRSERTILADPPPKIPGSPAEPPKLPDPRDPPPEPVNVPTIDGIPIPEMLRNEPLIFEALSEEIRKELAKPVYAERGKPLTVEANKLTRHELIQEALNRWGMKIGDRIEHVGGSFKHKTEEYLKEEYLQNADTEGMKGSSHADLTFVDKQTGTKLRVNTGLAKKDGTPIARERRQLENLAKNVGKNGKAAFQIKPGKDGITPEWRRKVIDKWVEILTEILGPPPK